MIKGAAEREAAGVMCRAQSRREVGFTKKQKRVWVKKKKKKKKKKRKKKKKKGKKKKKKKKNTTPT